MRKGQTFGPEMHLAGQKIEPIRCKGRMILCKLQRLLVNGPALLAMCATENIQGMRIYEYIKSRLTPFTGQYSVGATQKKIYLNTCEQFPLSNVVSFEDQQHCSRFSQNACGQMPNFKSVIQLAPISITPATQPDANPTSNTHNQPDQASCAPF